MSNTNDFVIEAGVLNGYTGTGGNVVIPDGVTAISLQAILDLRKAGPITSLILPNTVTDISLCKLYLLQNMESLQFGETISRIDYHAFVDDELSFWYSFAPGSDPTGEISWCQNLKSFDLAPQNKTFVVDDGVLFSKNRKKLVLCPSARETYAVPDGTTHIMAGAFYGALKLKTLILPESVANISGDAIRCTGIEYLRLPRAVEKLAKKAVDVPYVAVYHAAAADSVKYPVYLGGGIDDLTVKTRSAAVKGFFFALQHEISEIEAFEDTYIAYIERNIKTYCKQAITDDFILYWLMGKSLIPLDELRKMIKEAAGLDRPELTAALLNYQHQHFGDGKSDPLADFDLAESKHMQKVLLRREAVKSQTDIKDITFVVTGGMTQFGSYNEYLGIWDYSDLKKHIESRGGYLRSAVSLKTDYLICNDLNSTSVKMKTALELGVPVISEKEFMEMCAE